MSATLLSGLLAAACGGGDEGEATGSIDGAVKDGAQSQLAGSDGATTPDAPEPTSMEEWEALWATERAAIVDGLTSGGFGRSADGTMLTGPEGFSVDLSACGAGWSDTEGVTADLIKIGWPGPQSGPAADFGNAPRGAAAVLGAYAAEGAFADASGGPRDVEVIIRDDGYDAARTVPLVDEMIDSDKVFGLTLMGSANAFKVYDKLNQRCIPNTFLVTGHPAWGDPVGHPWTSGGLLSYSTEAILWGSYIEEHLDEWGGKATVAALVTTNDMGTAFDSSFRAYLAQSPRQADIEYVTESVEQNTPNIKDPMTTLAAQQPNVYIAMVPGTPLCTQSIIESAENGMREELDAAFLSSLCKASTYIGKDKVGGDGSVADGWQIIGGGLKDFNAEASADDPWIAWVRERLADAGHDYRTSANFGTGAALGWGMAQSLLVAQELPGGLTRSNFILAVRSMDMTNPALLPGVGFNMNGGADAYLVEGSDVSRWDAAGQRWATESTVELSGASRPCAWDQATATCG
ncbi:MAG: ABC transporter substrate-binding protein [Acidimicrobiia bacterium]|nr:ABC transporter substrate-binding protein [Acidimicrobiia bacterium]